MTRFNGHLTRRELIGSALATGGLAVFGAPVLTFAQQAEVDASPLDELGKRIRGALITPGHERYDEVRKVWNGMIDKRPAAIARCSGVADVIEVVKFARESGMPVSVRGGGHNVAGKSLNDGAITIDLAPMHGIWVDRAAKRGRAQGGVRWGAFDRETLAQGLVTTGGTVSDTGVAGLTLGGGMGWLMRKHGLACDNLVSANVVTADGRFLTASANENPDLYWALRGGGGNFGVVTSFEFRLHDAEPIVGGLAIYPREKLREMLRFFRDFTASAPDSISAQAGTLIGPPGTPVEGQVAGWMAACHSGPVADGERLVKPLKEFGPPVVDFIGPTTYTAIQTMFDPGTPAGMQNYWRSSFMRELSDEVIDALDANTDDMPRPGSLLLVEHLGGAIARVGEHETAFANRGAMFNVSLIGMWSDVAENEKNIAWVRRFGDELRAFSTGGAYVNYMASDETPERVRAAYETNFQRLVQVKRKYDPDNFFSANQNIAP